MPVYDFSCLECGEEYEELTKHDETGEYEDVKCPHCASVEKRKLVSGCKINFKNPVGTDLWNKSHDYRFHYNHERPGGVKDQRKYAEENSHVGPTPYNDIDDISGGNHFGDVE
jgi:putative FmdB family regulatory protein